MRHALALARRGLGRVAPNPAVGCVIVSPEGAVLGRGWTQPGGRPHAETVALKAAGSEARGATAYVTLEPCAHTGETPPCADALIVAGIARLVGAIVDPDPRVSGAGFGRLRAAGVAVTTDILASEAEETNAGFLMRIREGRPLVTLKIAQSLDGKVAAASGQSKWITGEDARRFGHLLRAQSDAILVGIETVLVDDPALTCRIPGLEDRSPLRVVLDTRGRLGKDSRIAHTAKRLKSIQFTADPKSAVEKMGVEVVPSRLDGNGRIDLTAMLSELGRRKVTRLLVEGGPTIHAAFLDAGLADRIELFTAPVVLGAGGRDSAASMRVTVLEEAPRFRRVDERLFGADLLESFVRRA